MIPPVDTGAGWMPFKSTFYACDDRETHIPPSVQNGSKNRCTTEVLMRSVSDKLNGCFQKSVSTNFALYASALATLQQRKLLKKKKRL